LSAALLGPEEDVLPDIEEQKKSNGSHFTAFENEIKPSSIVNLTVVWDIL
jgi:hypothetical protein